MRPLIIQLALCLYMLAPVQALAQSVSPKDPLNYPLRTWVFVLGIAIFGGFVSWYAKVVRKEIPGGSIFHLIGEITTSAFAGVIAFLGCEYADFPRLLTVALVGVSGHMGAKVITMYEVAYQRRAEAKLGGTQ